MAQRRHRAERAFEKLLRARRIPYVAVNEARKPLLPVAPIGSPAQRLEPGDPDAPATALKNFDFIVSDRRGSLLVEVKGRTIPATRSVSPRLDSWVTLEDVLCLSRWQSLFGPDHQAAFVFVYACPPDALPPDGLFSEIIELDRTWYAVRAVTLDDYRARMKVRSPKWRTVDLPRADFDRLSRPFAADPSGPNPVHHSALEPLGA